MARRSCALIASCFAAASGMNLVNRKSKMCLDLHAPCVDGTEDQGCQRMPAESLKKGTNLQLYKCNGKPNQEFELLANGRIRNPFTKLCIDIMAPCKDHFRSPCERLPVSELKGQANIQLYTCHEDKGVLSNSYGNQMWNFQAGELRNRQSNLCLEPKLDMTTGSMADMSNIWAETCNEETYQKFDFLEHSATQETNSEAPAGAVPAAVAPMTPAAAAPQTPAAAAPQTPAVEAPTAPLTVAAPPAILTPAPPPAMVTPAPPALMTPPPPVTAAATLPQAKFNVATSGSVVEAGSNTQPMAFLCVACVGLVAVFARSAWRRVPTEEPGVFVSVE